MSKYNPYKKIKKFLITERSLNYLLRHVQVRKENYPYAYTIENMGNKVEITVDRAWTFANHLILDFFGHELFEREYKDVKKRNTWKNNLSMSLLNNIENLMGLKDFAMPPDLEAHIKSHKEHQALKMKNEELKELLYTLDTEEVEKCQKILQSNDQKIAELEDKVGLKKLHDLEVFFLKWNSVKFYMVEFNRHKFIERYKDFFKNRRAEYLTELIKRTSEVTFSLEYPIRTPVIKKYDNKEEEVSQIVAISPETVKIENDKIFNYKFENDTIKIAFNTFLGRAYAHNLLTLNTDWLEEDFLKLDGYASAIYRRFFVTKSGNKVDQLPIKNIVDYFDLLKKCKYPEVIKKAFEDIKNAGLIADFKIRNNGGKFSKGYIDVKK